MRVIISVVLLAVLAGCSGGGAVSDGGTSFSSYAGSLPTVDLAPAEALDVPDGFARADVVRFQRDVLYMAERSLDPDVMTTDLDAAYEQITQNLYPATRIDLERRAPEGAGSYWKSGAATVVAKDSNPSVRVVKSIWDTSTTTGKLDDGTMAPILAVRLQYVSVLDAEGGPFVVQRHFKASRLQAARRARLVARAGLRGSDLGDRRV